MLKIPELELLKGVYMVLVIFVILYVYYLIVFFGRKKSHVSLIFLNIYFLIVISILFYFYGYIQIYDKKDKMIKLIKNSQEKLKNEYSKLNPKINKSKLEYLVPKNLSFIPIYYINLDKSTDRKNEMEEEMKNYSVINYYRISAVNGRDPEQLKNLETTAKNTSEIELATTMSHMKAIYTAYKNGDDYAIILEDDMSLSTVPFWKKSILEIIDEIVEIDPDWSILNIGQIQCGDNEMINHTEKNCYSACAYLINKRGMENIGKYIEEKSEIPIENGENKEEGTPDRRNGENNTWKYRITPGKNSNKFVAQGMPDNYIYEKSPGTWFYHTTLFYSRGNVSTIHRSHDLQNIVNTVRKLREFK